MYLNAYICRTKIIFSLVFALYIYNKYNTCSIPVNRDFRRKQRNDKTDQSMKIDQSVRLFGQMPRLVMPDKLYL